MYPDAVADMSAAMFTLYGEPCRVIRGALAVDATVVFSAITEEDILTANVIADTVIGYVRASDLDMLAGLNTGDVIERNGAGLEVIKKKHTVDGLWRAVLQSGIRITPYS